MADSTHSLGKYYGARGLVKLQDGPMAGRTWRAPLKRISGVSDWNDRAPGPIGCARTGRWRPVPWRVRPVRMVGWMRFIPAPLRDLGYKLVARSRYALFGQYGRRRCRIRIGSRDSWQKCRVAACRRTGPADKRRPYKEKPDECPALK